MPQLETAGFTNITTIDLEDAETLNVQDGSVESVIIGGLSDFKDRNYFDPNVPVVVAYH